MRLLLALLVLGGSGLWAQAPAAPSGHTVVLVALEGFRWDYARKDGAANLLAIAAHGASAPEGMLPAYPSQGCPNLETLATGLYPEHHGIVADSFYDGARRFSCAGSASSEHGEPLWALAERNGVRAACIGWLGCGGASLISNEDGDASRVEQTLAWLRRPEMERPRFLALALGTVDQAGRRFGPESPQTRAAVKQMDALVGRLRTGLAALRLPVDLVVVSDRGLAKTEGGWIDLDAYTDLSGFQAAGTLLYPPNEAEAQRVYEQLKIVDARFKVYRRKDVPRELRFNTNPREGDPVIVAEGPFAIRARSAQGEPDAAIDGFDPRLVPEMKAIFYAEGPDIRTGVKLKPFENVNVYPFLAGLLGIETPKVDGSAGVLSSALTH